MQLKIGSILFFVLNVAKSLRLKMSGIIPIFVSQWIFVRIVENLHQEMENSAQIANAKISQLKLNMMVK